MFLLVMRCVCGGRECGMLGVGGEGVREVGANRECDLSQFAFPPVAWDHNLSHFVSITRLVIINCRKLYMVLPYSSLLTAPWNVYIHQLTSAGCWNTT